MPVGASTLILFVAIMLTITPGGNPDNAIAAKLVMVKYIGVIVRPLNKPTGFALLPASTVIVGMIPDDAVVTIIVPSKDEDAVPDELTALTV